ncbi:MAG: hypothetical protein AB8B69_21660 [Chitinophagales bacterium]
MATVETTKTKALSALEECRQGFFVLGFEVKFLQNPKFLFPHTSKESFPIYFIGTGSVRTSPFKPQNTPFNALI